MRILVADDETLVRVGVKTIIPWEDYGHEIVAEAGNGLEALELFRRVKPDLALVDIMMPGIDGLEFISRARRSGSGCKFIILTCLNELKYVKEAMKLGVRDYIIKTSIDSKELLKIVGEMADEIESEKQAKAEGAALGGQDREEDIRALLSGGDDCGPALAEALRRIRPALAEPGAFAVSIEILHVEALKRKLEGQPEKAYSRGVRNICAELFSRYGTSLIMEDGEAGFLALLALRDPAADPAETVRSLFSRIVDTVGMLLSVELRIGASRRAGGPERLGRACAEAAAARESLFYSGGGFAQYREESGEIPVRPDVAGELRETLDGLFSCIMNLNFACAPDALDRVRGIVLAGGPALLSPAEVRKAYTDAYYWLVTAVKRDLMDIYHARGEFVEFYGTLREAESVRELHDCLQSLIRCINDATNERYGHKLASVVEGVKEYISENLAGDRLGMEDVAAHAGLSPGYFSKVFKREAGVSFSDYLLSCRIERAKGLIKAGEKIWAVASHVGYPDLSSFSRAFKKATGLSPSQYKGALGQ
jgi:two-component system response regulator YesN